MRSNQKYLLYLIILLHSTLAVSGCAPSTISPTQSVSERELNPQVPTADLASVIRGNGEFAFELYQSLRTEAGNLFFSPFSISSAFAMVYAGARNETERQISETLHFSLPQEHLHPAFNALNLKLDPPTENDADVEAFQLEVANSLWGQQGFEYQQEYLDLIAANYGAGMRFVDFIEAAQREQARLAINQSVSDETEGTIEELIQEGILTDMTRLVLANAIIFNAKWEVPFLNGTRNENFYLLDGRLISVPMMSRRAFSRHAAGPGYQAVEIPYKGDQAAMMVILPEPGQFDIIEGSWDLAMIDEIIQTLEPIDIKLYMPRFAFKSNLRLSETMAAMGMPDAFDTANADFTGISVQAEPRLFLKHVLHQAFVSVDELGTEAAAATAVIAEVASMPLDVRIDRPFLFFIYDRKNNAILFVGRVLDPTG